MVIDEEIGTHKSSRLTGAHCGRTNGSPPVHRLSPDLLATIFILCALNHHSRFSLTRNVPDWVNVSYVCRYWRDVALHCPTLWTYHFVVSLRWTEELLARSKQAPLRIRLGFEYGKSDLWWLGAVGMLMNHAERFEELNLRLPDSNSAQILSMLSSPAPCLHDLEIYAPDFLSEPSAPLLPFRGDTPALRTLAVADCSVPWYSFNLGSLTSLELFHLPDHFQQDAVEFLSTLKCMQKLTRLSLVDSAPGAVGFLSSTAFHVFQEFDLPHLVRLSIDAPLSTIIALLSFVSFPSITEISLGCWSENESTFDDYIWLASLLAPSVRTSENRTLPNQTTRSLSIKFMGLHAALSFSSPKHDCNAFHLDNHLGDIVPLQLFFARTRPMKAMQDRIICSMCCAIPLTNVQTISVSRPPFSPAFWREMLGHLPCLRYIKLRNGPMPDLASVLTVPNLPAREDVDDQAREQHRDRLLVPDLEELELAWIDFAVEGGEHMPRPAITRRALLDALATRSVNVFRGRLTMTQCTIGPNRFKMTCSWGDGHVHVEPCDSIVDVRAFCGSGSHSNEDHLEGNVEDDPGGELVGY